MTAPQAQWISEGGVGLPATTGRCPPLSTALPVGVPVGWRVLHLLHCEVQGDSLGQGEGEACVTGLAVCPPYVGRPKESAQNFIASPFGPSNILRTGDILLEQSVPVEYEDFRFRYVGRKDFQVKVNGVRMELGEIEAVVAEVEGVDLCIVKLHQDTLGDQTVKQLVAFYVGKQVAAATVQAHVSSKLPKAMVPHRVVHLSEFPRNDANKIDRKALVPPAIKESDLMAEGAFPVIDSLGFQRLLASQDEVWAHHCTEALYALVPTFLLYSHWCPFNIQDLVLPETAPEVSQFINFLHHIRILNVTVIFMGMSDRTAEKSYSPLKSLLWIIVLYLLMAWPYFFGGEVGKFATFHRWTFATILFFKLGLLGIQRVRMPVSVYCLSMYSRLASMAGSGMGPPNIDPLGNQKSCQWRHWRWIPVPGSLQVFVVVCLAPAFSSVPLMIYSTDALSMWNDFRLLVSEQAFYGSPNGSLASWVVLYANYLVGYYYGLYFIGMLRRRMEKLSRSHRALVPTVRMLAALVAIGMAWAREVYDTPVVSLSDVKMVHEQMWDWPAYFDGAYPIRVLAEWVFTVLLVVALGQGCWAWNVMGRNLLFVFVAHMLLAIDIPALLAALQPAGTIVQIMFLLLVPWIYSWSVGSIMFLAVVQLARLIRWSKAYAKQRSGRQGYSKQS